MNIKVRELNLVTYLNSRFNSEDNLGEGGRGGGRIYDHSRKRISTLLVTKIFV